MPDRLLYLAVDAGCLLFPLIFSFTPWFSFYKAWRYFVLPAAITALFFIVWDIIFTRQGVWGFNARYVCGIYIDKLPVEEILFFLFIPYACVFTYYCIRRYLNIAYPAWVKLLVTVLSVVLVAIGIIFLSHWYTSVTFILCGLLLFSLRQHTWMGAFLVMYALILIPFFISNGILTGAFTPEPVVWYNNNRNLGIRMITIPVEDTFYGMLLMLLNVAGYEYLKNKATYKVAVDA